MRNPSPLRNMIRRHASPSQQRGISLIIAMLMLVVIGLASVAIIRSTTSADQVVNNNRVQTQARQFAQVALQFCENQINLTPQKPGAVYMTPAAPIWKTKANWTTASATPVYTLVSGDFSSSVLPKHFPQCVAEVNTAYSSTVYNVTARGFSDDYTADTNSATISGSVVWLQSTLQ